MIDGPDDEDLPVLVVGAGPVGLTLACELLRRGVPTRIVDRAAAPTTESRAVAVHARTIEALRPLGVVDELLAASRVLPRVIIHAGERQLARLELGTVDSPYPYTAALPQTATEEILRRRLTELGGVVERPVEFTGLVQDTDFVTATVRTPDGADEIRCGWIVGTDGARSAVRAAAGSRLEGSFQGERFTIADVDVEHDYDPDAMHIFTDPGGPLLLIPMAGPRARVMAGTEQPVGHVLEIAEVQRVADERAGGIRVGQPHWLSIFEVRHAQVPSYRVGRVVLAGDAAHIHSPAGGQGMNTGIQDALNLAWKLDLARRGRGPVLLDSYGAERHPVAHAVIRGSTALTRVATVRRRPAQRLRGAVLPLVSRIGPVARLLADTTEEITIGYRHSPVVASDGRWRHGAVRAGEHAPQVTGLDGEAATLWDAWHPTRHTILYVPGAGDEVPPVAVLPEPYRDLVHHVVVGQPAGAGAGPTALVGDPGGRIADRYGTRGRAAAFVIRPDGYVGYRTNRPGLDVTSYFERILGEKLGPR